MFNTLIKLLIAIGLFKIVWNLSEITSNTKVLIDLSTSNNGFFIYSFVIGIIVGYAICIIVNKK